jgi:DNA-binding LacI/PurR family transcriptional regulator
MTNKPVRTIADIAKIAGVSKSTVSRALSNSSLISEETREKIQAIAREHNYQINQPARSLSMRQTNTIAFVTHGHYKEIGVEDLFLMEMLGAVSMALSKMNYDMLMVHVDPYETDWIHDYLNSGKVDAFILMTSTHKTHHINELVKSNAPFIAWGLPNPEVSFCTVNGDNQRGGQLAAEHLLALGKKKVAFIGGPSYDRETDLRFQGFKSVLSNAGVELHADQIVHGNFSRASGKEMMFKLLDQAPGTDAVFANSDLMAVGAMEAIHERGLQVPADISVIGYDDISLSQYTTPALTTIRQNISESGRLLVRNLITYLETGIVTNMVVPVDLVVRKSTE